MGNKVCVSLKTEDSSAFKTATEIITSMLRATEIIFFIMDSPLSSHSINLGLRNSIRSSD
jgi:hypothetical protein